MRTSRNRNRNRNYSKLVVLLVSLGVLAGQYLATGYMLAVSTAGIQDSTMLYHCTTDIECMQEYGGDGY